MKTRVGAAIAAGCLLASIARAQLGEPFTLDAKTYRSPSGAVTLHVDPSQRSGAGSATYRCLRDGQELWSGTRTYTFVEACVADDGLVAGYAYAAGGDGGAGDALTIAVIAPDGKARLEERSPREGMSSCLGGPEPDVRGLCLDLDNDRLIVRVTPAWPGPRETWWTYSLSSGTAGPRLDPWAAFPESQRSAWIAGVRAVPGTGLVLVHWFLSDFERDESGAVFTLFDREDQVEWQLVKPRDYTVPGNQRAESALFEDIRANGAILAVGSKTFTVREAATKERVTFQIERITGAREALEVREVERRPFKVEDARAPSAASKVPELRLEHLGSIELGKAAPVSTIRDVMDFKLDGQGCPGFVRRTKDSFEFVRVDRDGENAIEIPLVTPPEGAWWTWQFAWTSGERWIAIANGVRGGARYAGWLYVGSRSLTPIEGFSGPDIESIAGTPEGGFVVLGQNLESYSSTDHLSSFDRDGKQIFTTSHGQGDPDDPASLFAPEAVTVLANGEIVVLGNVREALQFFSSTGEFLRFVDLTKAWGREPNYPTGVHADRGGGLIVHDFDAPRSIVRTDIEGKILSAFVPHYADGRTFRLTGDVQAGANGTLWTSDGESLLALDGKGEVQRVAGSAPDTAVLGQVADLALGPDDRVYALDRRTSAVHVFDAGGGRLRVLEPEPTDFQGIERPELLTVTDSGEVHVGGVIFAADGSRLGKRSKAQGFAQRGSNRFWRLDYETLFLVDADGDVVSTIERGPSGAWLRYLSDAAVAPDGSIALMSGGFMSGPMRIHTFGPNGEPRSSFDPPAGMAPWIHMAFDGRRIAVGVEAKGKAGSIALLDERGQSIGRFQPEGKVTPWTPFFAAGGKELWLHDGERRIERFAMP